MTEPAPTYSAEIDCPGCTDDPRSEGTHSMGTRQHPLDPRSESERAQAEHSDPLQEVEALRTRLRALHDAADKIDREVNEFGTTAPSRMALSAPRSLTTGARSDAGR